MTGFVRDFAEGDRSQADLLGGKGANLAEMCRLGLPVPPGFTITTEACRAYLRDGVVPDGLDTEVGEHLARLERQMDRRLGDPSDPLLVSVRSGSKFSMPGMMETVLDVGLNDDSVNGLARHGGERFALDSYRRLIQMFGSTVLGIEPKVFATALAELKDDRSSVDDAGLAVDDLRELVSTYQGLVLQHAGRGFPQDPREQLDLAVRAVFDSWHTPRATFYRQREHISEDLGTAVNVQAMVFGNRGASSGSGVAFTRDPATGASGVYGDYLQHAQGEDVVSGIRNTVPLSDLIELDKPSYEELLRNMAALERHYRDMCDIEFTIEAGKLWMLQTRVGKRTPEAAFRIAHAMAGEGLVDLDEAVLRVTGAQLARLMFPRFDDAVAKQSLTVGIGASPGAAVGRVVLDAGTAVTWSERGEDVILVREETNPDDLQGMVAACGTLTSRGGKTSHAAVVARGMGRPCVCGAEALLVDLVQRQVQVRGGPVLHEGDVVSLDGTTGEVYAGAVPVVDSAVVRYFDGKAVEDPVVDAVAALLTHADGVRRMEVHANADTPEDAARARRFGAQGIGLCRTEHMFLGPRRVLVERLVLATNDSERDAALAEMLPLQREDFTRILAEMDGLPVTIRLIDPPLHEFLPDLTQLSVEVALDDEQGRGNPTRHRLLAAVRAAHEQNPMLGLRGVRLGLVIPGLVAMQARAILEAAADRLAVGGDPRPEIMVPLVSTVGELARMRQVLAGVAEEVESRRGFAVPHRVGTMIEVPRAALTADQIASEADFFSFGTNDLTQMTWGFSRDDVEAAFFPAYLAEGVLAVSPFESLDTEGVGSLITTAVAKGRQVRPNLALGVCGEHGGDPDSIQFFESAGLDYVSCSPFRLPVARLEAARAVLRGDARR
ncbi:pyruvate, phosphate dikinase [Marmoricola sp. URHB0036]|uniref:pyruvate, phosphate dikinase n=1 Tax=Marmoricola sp. URHB0036 TaxID=1298863 RepID=UPI00041F6427|nr:pyruvate, phosphate dikinase [Marmoricola sp. URHB0036]